MAVSQFCDFAMTQLYTVRTVNDVLTGHNLTVINLSELLINKNSVNS